MPRLFVRHNVTDYKVWRKRMTNLIPSGRRWGLRVTRFSNLPMIRMM